MPTADAAFEACGRLARTHYENFTMGSILLPRGLKRHLHALYAFARTTDDLGDESPGDRLANLDAWEEDFRKVRGGTARHPVHQALTETVRQFDLPDEPFLRLIESNRIDQRRSRHETFADLADYCTYSANPCGRLVLGLLGVRDPESVRMSDATCTALQLVNFWQDLAGDWERGRVYLPQEDLRRFGYSEEELARGEANDRYRALMRFEAERTRALFREGWPLADRLRGRARFDIRLFTRGGWRVLDLIEGADFDVFRRRPTLSRLGKAWLAASTLLGVGP